MLFMVFMITVMSVCVVPFIGAYYLIRWLVDCIKCWKEVRVYDDFDIAGFYHSLL